MSGHGRHSKSKEQPVREEAVKDREDMMEHEDQVVVSSDESFPASDPPSFNPGITGASDIKKKKD
ncbi:MAG TPA: hypothetical protein VN655_01350 [Pseudolabrys sp.]|nr:hypothetical protein [Pseudolabrys sp.]